MFGMKSKPNTRKDFTQVAFNVVQTATGEMPPKSKVTPKKKRKEPLGTSSRVGRNKSR